MKKETVNSEPLDIHLFFLQSAVSPLQPGCQISLCRAAARVLTDLIKGPIVLLLVITNTS